MTDTSSPGFVVQVMAQSKDVRLGSFNVFAAKLPILARMSDFSPRVERFEYVDTIAGFKQLKIAVDNFDLQFFDHPAWVIGNVIRFFFGYPGKIQGPYWGVVNSIRGFQKLEITCVETAALSNEEKTKVWKNTTRVGIIAELVKSGAFPGTTKLALEGTPPLDPAAFVGQQAVINQLIAASVSNLFGFPVLEKARDFSQSRQTDWQFAARLAGDLGFELYTEDDALHFHQISLNKGPEARPIKKYEWFTGAGELLEFDIEEWRGLGRATTVDVYGRNPIERVDVSASGSNGTTERDTLGSQGISGQETVYKAGPSGQLFAGKQQIPTPKTEQSEVSNFADSQFRYRELEEVQATATVIGEPRIRANRMIELVGISKTLQGNYYVQEVTHRIDSSGYRTIMKLHRNAVSAVASSSPPDLDPTKTKENDQTAPSNSRFVVGPRGQIQKVQ